MKRLYAFLLRRPWLVLVGDIVAVLGAVLLVHFCARNT